MRAESDNAAPQSARDLRQRLLGMRSAKERGKLLRYLIVGSAAALAYLAIAFQLEHRYGFSPAVAGTCAYLVLMPLTYLGHRRHSFRSTNRGLAEPGRFIAWSLTALLLAGIIPGVFVFASGGPSWIGNLVACVVIPVLNFLVMDQWVFSRRRPSPAGSVADAPHPFLR